MNLRTWKIGLKAIGISILATAMITACQNKDEKPSPDGKAIELVREAEKLQEGVRLGHRLSSLTVRDRDALTVLLADIKLGLLRVAENSSDVDALRVLKRGLVEWDKHAIQLQRTDESVFSGFIVKVYGLLNERSLAAGINADDLSWVLYKNDFATGVEPFSSISNGAQWEADWALDEPLVRVKGYDVKAWLITPTFDLREVRDPAFRIEHLFMINRDTGRYATDEFDRTRIVNEAFKVLVSTNYEDGDPMLATWEAVDVSPLPSSYNFHAVQSPLVSLHKFRGEKVAVAFLFEMPSGELGHHYVTWQLNRFELFGAGPVPRMQSRPRTLWGHSFNATDFKPFQSASYGSNAAAKWTPFSPTPGGKPKWAKIGSNGTATDAWLLSPRIQLDAKELSLNLRETVKNPLWPRLRVLISDVYQGGDPRQSSWQELPRPKIPQVEPDVWKDIRSGPFDLTAFQGKKVVIAFQFDDNGDAGDRAWEIETLQISGLAEQDLIVEEKDYLLHDKPGAVTTDLQVYAFDKASLDPFATYAIANSASTWAPLALKGVYKYAKAGSGATAADTWLLSPRMTISGTDLKVTVKHTVKNPNWTQWQMLISTDYAAGSPELATWTPLNIAPAANVIPERWTDLVTPEIDLMPYAGRTFVIAFRYQDPGGAGARVWEIESLRFFGQGQFQALGPVKVN